MLHLFYHSKKKMQKKKKKCQNPESNQNLKPHFWPESVSGDEPRNARAIFIQIKMWTTCLRDREKLRDWKRIKGERYDRETKGESFNKEGVNSVEWFHGSGGKLKRDLRIRWSLMNGRGGSRGSGILSFKDFAHVWWWRDGGKDCIRWRGR